jgi:TolA-binding protein
MEANRTLFKKYLKSGNLEEKRQVETTFVDDDFVMDAIEGFREQQDSWQRFETFDRKYNKKQRRRRWSILGLLLLFAIGVSWFFVPGKSGQKIEDVKTSNTQIQTIKIHNQEEINQMITASVTERISARQVIQELQINTPETEQKAELLARIPQVPAQHVDLKSQHKQRLTLKIGRELLIKNFKVLDYRYYRNPERANQKVVDQNEFGDQELKIPYINLLSRSIEDFSKEAYKLALLHFDQILTTYPDDANALFYGAMCLYNLREFNQAESRFLKLQNIPFANFREEGNWYLLHVYQQTKKEAAFSSLRNTIINEKGFYAQKAESLMYN